MSGSVLGLPQIHQTDCTIYDLHQCEDMNFNHLEHPGRSPTQESSETAVPQLEAAILEKLARKLLADSEAEV